MGTRSSLPVITWQSHVERWRHCEDCHLAQCRTQVVLARGKVPCDILFIGEAPGRSEDVAQTAEGLGKPFVGPAGKYFDDLIEEAIGDMKLRCAFTNLIACLPLDEEDSDKLEQPPPESVAACSDRLAEFVQLARPKLIVRTGKEATVYLMPGYHHSVRLGWDCPHIDIFHPSAILRAKFVQQSAMWRETVIKIRKAAEKLSPGRPASRSPYTREEIPF